MSKWKRQFSGQVDAEDMMQPRSMRWFRETQGLNDSGYIPGVDLPVAVMSKKKVVAA
jgi:hypothetical protein